jgi:hypothetical protein
LCLPSGITKNKNPSILTKLPAEVFRLFDQLLPTAFKSFASVFQFFTGGGEDISGS